MAEEALPACEMPAPHEVFGLLSLVHVRKCHAEAMLSIKSHSSVSSTSFSDLQLPNDDI